MTDPTVPTPRVSDERIEVLLDPTKTPVTSMHALDWHEAVLDLRAARRQIEELRGALAKINATLDEVGILTVTDAQRLIYQIARAALASTPASEAAREVPK